jgi:hypothetical protein
MRTKLSTSLHRYVRTWLGCLVILTALILNPVNSLAQSTAYGTPEAPPSQAPYSGYTYGFTRGLYIDCADEIIQDMANGNSLGLEAELKDYITTNFINYIALFSLDNNRVV